MACLFRYKNSKIWWLKWYEGGRARYRSTKTSDDRVAKYLLNKLEQTLAESKVPVALRKISFNDALEEYFNYARAHNMKRSWKGDERYIRAYFRLYPMPRMLSDFNARQLETYVNARVSKKEITRITGTGWLRPFKSFFNWCVSRDYLEYSPMAKIKNFTKSEKLPEYLSKEEISRMQEAAREEDLTPFLMTAVYTGLRYEELKYLDWSDIDFKHNQVRVINKPEFTVKSKKNRIVPLHSKLRKILYPLRSTGKCFDTKNIRRRWDRVREEANLHGKDLHSLRHTFGAYCAMTGIPMPLLKNWMGHASISTTMIYAKLKVDFGNDQIERLDF